MNIYKNLNDLNKNDYLIVKYYLKSTTNLNEAAWALAIGQSVGNPKVRNKWETEELFEKYSCIILDDQNNLESKTEGIVYIAFPTENLNFEKNGISHMLVNLMGGQLDIDVVDQCHILDIEFPNSILSQFKGPKYGISGIREFTNSYDKPLLGAIVKPKIGVTPQTLLEMVKELVEGGVNFIKEDEIMSEFSLCPLEERVPLVMNYLKDKNVIYSVSIHCDPDKILDRVKLIHSLGGNSVHVNFWCGLGVYRSIRELNLPIFIHFQKSGDKIFTNKSHAFHIDWRVVCKIAGLSGVDFIHAGMIGGYYKWDEQEVIDSCKILTELNVMPAISCGFNAGLTDMVNSRLGVDYMANVGGGIHGHPNGTLAGAKSMRQSIDKIVGTEYIQAIEKWGYQNVNR
jgi:ribulose-bisphosphate carboxylase large chain